MTRTAAGRWCTLATTWRFALRHGKMIRRPALEPEPTRLLEEAVGAPWAAWETVRRFATVTRGPGGYQLTRSTGQVVVVRSVAASNSLRSWRDTVRVDVLAGEARVDPRTGALLAFTLHRPFQRHPQRRRPAQWRKCWSRAESTTSAVRPRSSRPRPKSWTRDPAA